jgi:hypothetical protein
VSVRWLITVPTGTDLSALSARLGSARASLRDVDPVPMGTDELVVFAEGPRDLPALLRSTGGETLTVYPDSEPEPY